MTVKRLDTSDELLGFREFWKSGYSVIRDIAGIPAVIFATGILIEFFGEGVQAHNS
jgi:hypothetical protein